MARYGDAEPFDIVFCDTCIGGSTVAADLARPGAGLRAFFLADYAVNPLGTRDDEEVRDALQRWVDIAARRSDTMIVACNTASVRLEESPEVRETANARGVQLHSMVDLFDSLLRREAERLRGKRVCVMGTRYTVSRPVHAGRLSDAGVGEVIPLGATRTERAIAHLVHTSAEGRALIREEIEDSLAGADAVLLACTCFPLIGDLIDAIRPGIRQLDPGLEVRELVPSPGRGGPNQLTLAYTGTAVTADTLRAQAPALFPGWDEITVVSLPD